MQEITSYSKETVWRMCQENWNKSEKLLENDIIRPQIMGFRIFKLLHLE
jgi:hypothetical protein